MRIVAYQCIQTLLARMFKDNSRTEGRLSLQACWVIPYGSRQLQVQTKLAQTASPYSKGIVLHADN